MASYKTRIITLDVLNKMKMFMMHKMFKEETDFIIYAYLFYISILFSVEEHFCICPNFPRSTMASKAWTISHYDVPLPCLRLCLASHIQTDL